MKTSTLRSFACGAAVVAVLIVPREARAQDSVAAARDLYASAAYEDALVVLGHLDVSRSQPSERFAVNQYRAFCLVALRRTGEAEQAIELMLSDQPLYRPADADASPRLKAAFASVRQRILPAIVQQKYAHAKAAFDRQEYAPAVVEFDSVLQTLGDADLGDASTHPPLSDVRTLATGFRDLSVRATAPAPVVAAAPPPAPAVSAVPVIPVVVPNRIYNAGDPDVSLPIIVRQDLPSFPHNAIPGGLGALEVIINEDGSVDTATMRNSINPRYDAAVLTAARTWRYKPATVAGTPVKFRKMISIAVKPGA